MSLTQCAHCGFFNFAHCVCCGRCEQPLQKATPTNQAAPIFKRPPQPFEIKPASQVETDPKQDIAPPPMPTSTLASSEPPKFTAVNVIAQDSTVVVDLQELAKRSITQATEIDENEDTVVPTACAPFWRLALALLIDLAVFVAMGGVVITCETSLFGSMNLPDTSSPIESLAMWLNLYPQTAQGMLTLMVFAMVIYTTYGARYGATLGRWLTGLLLLQRTGHLLSWPRALWRALWGVFSGGCFVAGYFWMVVDRQHRTWHDILSGSLVVIQQSHSTQKP